MKKIKKFFKKEQGNVLVLVSISFMALLTFTGLIIDGGMLYMTKSHLQKVANAAALSGAQELTDEDETEVEEIVDAIIAFHRESAALSNINVTLNEQVSVDLDEPVELAFSSLLGFETINVSAQATASLGKMGRVVGAAPLGINESISLEYGVNYELKVDSDDVDTGNFGILALEGPGAATYEDNLRHGFQEELKVGDIVDTQTGNIAGKTKKVVDELVDSCDDPDQRDCRRILLVPVYQPYNQDSNQMKQVQITGFAYFYILERMQNNDTSITGMFIKRTDTGFEDTNAVDRGAYSIRLTE
ncbi:pilus assembly protein TadG-related protein [Aquibacillus albus]|uniref:Putative Flp pilus-assembly TadG-like N-terminal domain-containing protein n=1 Tax=Aquibacillus albus TaxID=1168171 RepID=A0ABS2N3X2_9BACI|nr:Tad domain-containing protein [Aquibacillus albus]MBM7572610.1 hypothetical protein [Aquibacillus albus]